MKPNILLHLHFVWYPYGHKLEGTRIYNTDMEAMKTRFSRKLHIAFATMLMITLALAWYFYDSVQWFEYDVERITIANSVLNGHRTLAAQTTLKLSMIDESVANDAISDLPRWHENSRLLRVAIIDIRHALAAEGALGTIDGETDESAQ